MSCGMPEKKFSKNWHTARHRNEGRGVCQFLLNFFLNFCQNFQIFSKIFRFFQKFFKIFLKFFEIFSIFFNFLRKKFSKNWHTARHRNEGRGVCQFLLNYAFYKLKTKREPVIPWNMYLLYIYC
jgi:hypothetical protein